eukprot:1159314-Pyramimonas_sp.AAC.1
MVRWAEQQLPGLSKAQQGLAKLAELIARSRAYRSGLSSARLTKPSRLSRAHKGLAKLARA